VVQPPGQTADEQPGKHDVGQKVPALDHPHRTEATADRERAGHRERAPAPRQQREREQEIAGGGVAGDERAVVVARVDRQQCRAERHRAAELDDMGRPRASPVILEHDVGEEPGAEQ